jgi:hypothetical protein
MSILFRVNRNGTPINLRTNNPPTPYLITLFEHNLGFDTHKLYNITFDSNHTVQTLVTSSPDHADMWFIETLILSIPSSAIIGLHIEWSPNPLGGQSSTPATLQLCINNICLIYQIIHAPYICPSISNFLADPTNVFVGVGIKAGVEKLLSDYNYSVAKYIDLRSLAAWKLNDREMLSSGLKTLAERVLGKVVEKPQSIAMSRWDNPQLSADQVKYATLDAHVSCEIGRCLCSNQI